MRWSVALSLLLTVLVAPAQASAGGSPAPERVVSMRMRILPRDRYAQLARDWKAYTVAHPREALGWYQLARASRYAGSPSKDFVAYAEKAVRLEPKNAEALATLGSYRWSVYCPGQPQDPAEAIRLLERALQLDPRLDDPHYTLWVMYYAQGRRGEADAHLRSLLDGGRMPEPLVDLAHNLLVGLEPDAILLTNGDNDTYPLVALQTARSFRTDVAVVNVSLLNLPWYRRDLREGASRVPVPLLDGAGATTRSASPSDEAVKELLMSLAASGWKRPLYAAVTVGRARELIPNRLALEGLVYRVLPAAGADTEIDAARLTRNFDGLYRLGSVNSVALDWEAWSGLRPLMFNYCAAAIQLAPALARDGDLAAARSRIRWALDVATFHRCERDRIEAILSSWSQWDPDSPELARWKETHQP